MPMVFGNLNNESGTGVAFTRDPATGENKLMGEFLINAQGEDVVAGVRTPMPIAQMEQEFPEAYAEFLKVCETLENHYHDMQDMEFTVENKKLYMLQCRNGKRTAPAALKIACDLVDEGHKTPAEAVAMIDLVTLIHYYIHSSMLLHLRLQLHLERVLEHLRELLVVRLYSQLTMLRHGLKEEKKSYLYVLRHLQRTSQE